MSEVEKPVFQIKKETHPAHLNAVRVSSRAFAAITEIARISSVSQNEVVRQMLDFAIAHWPDPMTGPKK